MSKLVKDMFRVQRFHRGFWVDSPGWVSEWVDDDDPEFVIRNRIHCLANDLVSLGQQDYGPNVSWRIIEVEKSGREEIRHYYSDTDPYIWNSWYAWRPILVGYKLYWFRIVQRRWICYADDGVSGYWGWEYRLPIASSSSQSD